MQNYGNITFFRIPQIVEGIKAVEGRISKGGIFLNEQVFETGD